MGRWIVAHREVPHVDYWNMFAVGQPWRAYSWSSEVVYAWVESLGGERGLAILSVCLAALCVGSMQYVFGAMSGSYFLGALLGAFSALACIGHFSLRPQTLTWVLFCWVIFFADVRRHERASRGALVAMLVLGCVWANTHLSAILGVVGVLLWSLGSTESRGGLRRSALLVACFILGTFLSPYLGGEWLTLFEKSTHALRLQSIDEFRPATIVQYSSGFVVLQMALLIVGCFSIAKAPAISRMVLLVVMFFVGLAVVKFLPFAVITLSSVLAVLWREHGVQASRSPGASKLLEGFAILERRVLGLQPATLGALAFFIGAVGWVHMVSFLRQPIDYTRVPKRAVDYLLSGGFEHPILNQFGTGGYLIYRYSSATGEPAHLVPVDGRTNVNRADIWRAHEKALLGREGWQDYLNAVKPKTVLWRQDSPLVAILLAAPEWCRVFQSGNSGLDHSVFISREDFEKRRDTLQSADCQ